MKSTFVFFICLLLVSVLFGQEKDWRLYGSEKQVNQTSLATDTVKIEKVTPGTINIVESNNLDTLLVTLLNNPPTLKGFRVRIYMGTSRDNADDIRSIYLKNEYPWQHYLSFKDPNFVVEIGDFMTRLQAEKVKEELGTGFSNPYIVLTGIKPPDYDTEIRSSN